MLDAYLNIHTHIPTGQPHVYELVSVHLGQSRPAHTHWQSIGLHPWWLSANTTQMKADLFRESANNTHVLAIGESGLDKLTTTSWHIQMEAFAASIQIAQMQDKPLIIHCVRAWQEILSMLKEANFQKAIFHGFAKNATLARQIVDAGHYLSFGKALSQKNVSDALQSVPPDRFFLETDDSPMSIETVYGMAAQVLGWPLARVKAQAWHNFAALFPAITDTLYIK